RLWSAVGLGRPAARARPSGSRRGETSWSVAAEPSWRARSSSPSPSGSCSRSRRRRVPSAPGERARTASSRAYAAPVRIPVVGITAYAEQAQFGAWDVPTAFVPLSYVRAVEEAGGRALLVP